MSDIQRYLRRARSGAMVPDNFGAWCRYDDVAAEIERLRRHVRVREDEALELRDEIERLRAADRLMVAQFLDQEREATRLRGLLRE